ncbi:transglutaminase domain-containing protein [bacterium AH-315-P07]|nr:transglutaminase domain-containing protein [bacterium AH-315-P07]
MNRLNERQLAYVMLVAQIPVFMYLSGTFVFPMVAVIIGFGCFNKRFQLSLTNNQLAAGCVALIFLMYLVSTMSPVRAEHFTRNLRQFGLVTAQYFLAVQVLMLFVEQKLRLPKLYPIVSGITLMLIGDKVVNPAEYVVFQTSAIVYVGLFAMLLRARQSRRRSAVKHAAGARSLIVMLVLVALVSTASSRVMFVYHRQLDGALMRFVSPDSFDSGTYIDRDVILGDVAQQKAQGGSAVALRVFSDGAPGYMRGAIYDKYNHSRRTWINSMPEQLLSPQDSVKTADGDNRFYLSPLSPLDSFNEGLDAREVWPSKGAGNMVYTQLHTPFVDMDVPDARMDEHGALKIPKIEAGAKYTLHVDPSKADRELSDKMRAALLFLPEEIDDRIRKLANEIFEGATSREEKAQRIRQYFNEEYEYNVGIKIPKGEDPLIYFLLEKPPAHCELFASGAMILLRLGGIPCRYVTGFITIERNSVGGYWVSRGRHAHAWVESWDEEKGWIIVEATPLTGIPSGDSASRWSYYWDEMKFKLSQFKEALFSGGIISGLKTFAGQLAQRLWMWVKSGGIFVVIAIFSIFGLRRWRRGLVESKRESSFEGAEFRELLSGMDALVETRGIRRTPGETLTRFSLRLEEVENGQEFADTASWYRAYAKSRYNPASDQTADILTLNEGLAKIQSEAPVSPSI